MIFDGSVHGVLDDKRSNASSLFVYSETRRVLHDIAALLVPGFDRSRGLHPQPRAPSTVAGSIRSRRLHPQSLVSSVFIGVEL